MKDPIVIGLVILAGLILVYVVWEAWYKSQQAKKAAGQKTDFDLPKPPALPPHLEALAESASDSLAKVLAKVDADARAAKARLITEYQAKQQETRDDPVSRVARSIASTYATLTALPDSPEKQAAVAAYETTIGPTTLAVVKGTIQGA